MAKNQNTFAKRQREMEKKAKAEAKRARRKRKQEQGPDSDASELAEGSDVEGELPDDEVETPEEVN